MTSTTLALEPVPEAPDGHTDPKPPRYDLSYRDAFWPVRAYEDRCDRIALRALLPRSGGHLVDLGAGFGRLVDEYGAFEAVSLVDASPVMVEAASERVAADPRCTVVLGNSTDLPMRDDSVDVVVSVRLLVHLLDPAMTFREVSRALRTGGSLIVEFPNRRHLLARIRYRLRRQAWNPTDRQPHEYVPGHFSHHPETIEHQLREAGLVPAQWRSVSLFRVAWLTNRVPAFALAAIEWPLQGLLGRLGPGPSTYVRAIKAGSGASLQVVQPGFRLHRHGPDEPPVRNEAAPPPGPVLTCRRFLASGPSPDGARIVVADRTGIAHGPADVTPGGRT